MEMNNMNTSNSILTTHELAQISYKNFMDDRLDYIIDALNNVISSNENSIEDKVLAFEKLSIIYLSCQYELDKSLEYIDRATKLADSTDIGFSYILRGDIWENKLKLLEILGKEEEIEVELNRIISKYEAEEFKSNSYLYNAYKCKASFEYKKGDFEAALCYLKDAQRYYPVRFFSNRLHVTQSSDHKNEYDNLELLLSRNVCSINDWQM